MDATNILHAQNEHQSSQENPERLRLHVMTMQVVQANQRQLRFQERFSRVKAKVCLMPELTMKFRQLCSLVQEST
jgi:hypothetical protein